jgi:predicted SAM-dependent methyltransferase
MLFWSGKEVNADFEKYLEEIVFSGDIVLDIGCGKQKVHPRCLGVDAYEDYPTVNVQAYMWDLPFADNTVDGLLCMSALEHISKYQVMPTLREFERILKPGALFVILVPDLEWVCKRFLDEPNVNYGMDMIFGEQSHEGQFHKTGFTEDIFALYFTEACKNSKIINFFRVDAYSQENLGFICQKEKEWVNTESPSL